MLDLLQPINDLHSKFCKNCIFSNLKFNSILHFFLPCTMTGIMIMFLERLVHVNHNTLRNKKKVFKVEFIVTMCSMKALLCHHQHLVEGILHQVWKSFPNWNETNAFKKVYLNNVLHNTACLLCLLQDEHQSWNR